MIKLLTSFLLAALAMQLQAGTYNAVISIGDPMPSFYQLPATDGSLVSSSDLEDADLVVLVSMANHCPWSNGADADTSALSDRFADNNVKLVAFSVSHREEDKLPAMTEHAQAAGYSFDYLYDQSQKLGLELGATTTPEYFVFDQERKLVYSGLLHNSPATNRGGTLRYTEGEPTEFYVRDAIEATLAGEPVALSETQPFGCVVEYQQQ